MSDPAQAIVSKAAEQVPSSTAKRGRKYLFAILYAEDVRHWDCAGMDGKEVSVIVEGRLAAVVGGVSGPKVRPERRNLAAHQQVLKELLAHTTPLPMSFGILACHSAGRQPDPAPKPADVSPAAQHVAGKVEMGLRVNWDVPNIFEYFVNTHDELRAARDRILGADRPHAAGLSTPQAMATSLLVFTGASQFAFIGVLAAGGGRSRLCAGRDPGAAERPLRHLAGVAPGRAAAAAARALPARDRRDDRDGPGAGRPEDGASGVRSPPASRSSSSGTSALRRRRLGRRDRRPGRARPRRDAAGGVPGAARAAAPPATSAPIAIAGGLIALVVVPIAPAGLPIVAAGAAVARLAPATPARRERRMIWLAIGVLAADSRSQGRSGPVLVGDVELGPRAAALVALLPVPMLAALVVVGTSPRPVAAGRRAPAGRGGRRRVHRAAAAVPGRDWRPRRRRPCCAPPSVSRAPRGGGRTRRRSQSVTFARCAFQRSSS